MLDLSIPGRRVLAAAGVALGVALAAPGAADAKTYTALPKDTAGDSVDGSLDIVSSRIAYNRRSGAISVSITTDEPIDADAHDAVVAVYLSNLVHGKCTKPILVLGGVLSQPDQTFAQRYNAGSLVGPRRLGSGSVDGSTFSMRVRNRSLAGDTPGCTGVALLELDEANPRNAEIYDQTAGNDGFA